MHYQDYDQFLSEFKTGVADLSSKNQGPKKRLAEMLDFVRGNLERQRKYIRDNPFPTQAEEIFFFKFIKPELNSHLLYELLVFQVANNQPQGTRDEKINYYEEELKQIRRFFDQNRFYYEYYRNGLDEMDDVLFTSNANLPSITVSEIPEADPVFSSALDYTFAKFMAYERLKDYLLDQIKQLVDRPIEVQPMESKSPNGLTWTGETINLVELAYGIWLTGQMNNGNATISEIIRWLEDSLHIKIGRAYRRWTEISRRDRANSTKYLDRMCEAIRERLENEDDLRHSKIKKHKSQH